MSSLFPPGQIVATPGALDALRGSGPALAVLLARHVSADWGDVDAHDQQANDAALRDGSRLLSAYTLDDAEQAHCDLEGRKTTGKLLLVPEGSTEGA